ncbi:MAG: PxKF domain-containing protein [Chloroflexota bacterium]|nr:PxKF domain-containing protein [Chloroflexota bacterium]
MKTRKIHVSAILVVFMVLALAVPYQNATATSPFCVKPGGVDGCHATIQGAIDAATAGDTIDVYPGSYSETAANRIILTGTPVQQGPHQFGLFFSKDKPGLTLIGVDASGNAITDPTSIELPYVTTNATNNFGYSGIWVEADNITIQGLNIGPNNPGNNKTFEIVANGFTLRYSKISVPGGGSIYFGDWQYDAGTEISKIESYTIDHNLFEQGALISINSGAGYSGDVSGRTITNNVFLMNGATWPAISFTGSGTTVPWFVHPVGGAVITGNDFSGSTQYIRSRGTVDDADFDWASYWNHNTFDKKVMAGSNPPAEPRAYTYMSGSFSLPNTKRIGAVIQEEIGNALAGDTVLIGAGNYVENIQLNKHVALLGAGTASTFLTNAAGGSTAEGVIQISASGLSDSNPVLVKELTINPVGRAGVSIGRFTQATGTTVNYLALENIKVDGTNNHQCTEQERGLYVDLNSSLMHLSVKDSTFMDLTYGWYFHKAVSADGSTVQYVTVENTAFTHNNLKGLYIEKLEDASFNEVLVDGNGFGPAASLSGCSYFQPHMGGVDINLKAGGYQNISFTNSEVLNNGLGNASEGFGIAFKARSDGPTYGPFPATLDHVDVTNTIVTGNERGIRIGEPGKNNPGPTNVEIHLSNIFGNVQTSSITGSAYGGLVNQSTAPLNAEANWWGIASGPAAGDIAPAPGTIDFTPWLCVGTDTSPDRGFQTTGQTDCTAPVITPNVSGTLGNNGWYISDVTVTWTVSAGSAISSSTGCESTTINTDTTSLTLTCSATSDGGTSSESVTIKRDATNPTLTPAVSPNPVLLNGSATAVPNASDSTSGIASSSCDPVDTSTVGAHSVACSATDSAGNTNSASASYSVGYNFAGFFQPVDNLPALNIAKAGQAIPLKWRLTDANGAPILDLTTVTVTVSSLSCSSGTTVDQIEEYASGASGLQNLGNGYYQFNWNTPRSYASSCKTLNLKLGDGIVHTAQFQFKR